MDRIQKKYPATNTIVGQHYIEWLDANTATPTSYSSPPVLTQCQGCHLDDLKILLSCNSYSTCLFTNNASLIMILDQSNIQYPDKRIQLIHQFSNISEQSYFHFESITSSTFIKHSNQPSQLPSTPWSVS